MNIEEPTETAASTHANGFITSLLAAVNDHDLDALVGCFTDDYVNETPVHPARGFVGNDQVRKNWSTIFGAVPDLAATVTATATDGDTLWSEWEMTGTRRDGAAHHMRGVMIFTVRGRQASAVRFYLEPVATDSGDVDAAISRTFVAAGQ